MLLEIIDSSFPDVSGHSSTMNHLERVAINFKADIRHAISDQTKEKEFYSVLYEYYKNLFQARISHDQRILILNDKEISDDGPSNAFIVIDDGIKKTEFCSGIFNNQKNFPFFNFKSSNITSIRSFSNTDGYIRHDLKLGYLKKVDEYPSEESGFVEQENRMKFLDDLKYDESKPKLDISAIKSPEDIITISINFESPENKEKSFQISILIDKKSIGIVILKDKEGGEITEMFKRDLQTTTSDLLSELANNWFKGVSDREFFGGTDNKVIKLRNIENLEVANSLDKMTPRPHLTLQQLKEKETTESHYPSHKLAEFCDSKTSASLSSNPPRKSDVWIKSNTKSREL